MAQPSRFAMPHALVALALIAGSAGAAPPARGSVSPASLYFEWLSGWDGPGDAVRYGIDPETGDWGYVSGASGGLALSSTFAEPVVEHRADGSTVVYLDQRFADFLVAHIGKDGKPAFGCVPAEDLRETLAAPAAAPDR
jgi:hypothetical protein